MSTRKHGIGRAWQRNGSDIKAVRRGVSRPSQRRQWCGRNCRPPRRDEAAEAITVHHGCYRPANTTAAPVAGYRGHCVGIV